MKSNIAHLPLRAWPSIQYYWENGNIYGFTLPHYPKAPASQHYADKWRDYVAAVYDSATHKTTGRLTYDEGTDIVTDEVIVLTVEEIAQRTQAAIDSDASAQRRQRETSDGAALFEKFLVYIQREYDQGRLTGNQAITTFNLLYLPLLPMKDGMFRIVQANLNTLTPPASQPVLAILNLVKQRVADYITANP